MQQSNGVGRGRGKDGGTKVSNNLSILFARAPSLYSRHVTPFFCISSDSRYGQRNVATGLSIAKGRQSKGQFLYISKSMLLIPM